MKTSGLVNAVQRNNDAEVMPIQGNMGNSFKNMGLLKGSALQGAINSAVFCHFLLSKNVTPFPEIPPEYTYIIEISGGWPSYISCFFPARVVAFPQLIGIT
jgi:hypothetical protein